MISPGGPGAPEQALERGLDVRRHADPGQHRLAGEQLHRADRVAIKRIRHRHRQALCGIGERQDARLFEKIGADAVAGQRQIRIVGLAASGRSSSCASASATSRSDTRPSLGRSTCRRSWLASRARCARPSPDRSSRPLSTSRRSSASSTEAAFSHRTRQLASSTCSLTSPQPITSGPHSQTSQKASARCGPNAIRLVQTSLPPPSARGQGQGEPARRGDQHDARQGLPAEPGARRRQQLGVAEPEPLAAAHPAIDAGDHGQ